TNSEPVDADGDGTYDNVTAEVDLSGQGFATGGFVYLNANFRTTGNGNTTLRQLIAPAEPYVDANGNGKYDPDEWFVDLTYPAVYDGTYGKNGMHRVIDGYTRQDPSVDAGPEGKYDEGINVYGVFYIAGVYDAQGNWLYFGSVVTKTGMTASGGG